MKSLNRSIQLLLLVMGVSITGQVLAETEIKDDQYIIFYHNDALGSPAVVTDHNGNTLWHEQNEPFGRARDRVMPTGKEFFSDHSGSRKGYTGHLKDSGSDLVYMKARFYDPVIGRFYSNDPVGFTESNPMMFNRYAYASNSPYIYIDPDGKNIVTAIGGFLSETWEGISSSGDGEANYENLWGAAADGYNGEGAGFVDSAIQDATSLVPAGATVAVVTKWKKLKELYGSTKKICSFDGSTEVLTDQGYVAIKEIKIGTKVMSRDEINGVNRYRDVLDQYSNIYDQTVRISMIDTASGDASELISNTIHPFFAVRDGGISDVYNSPVSQSYNEETVEYRGQIPNGGWVSAANLQQGDLLLNTNNGWTEVVNVSVLNNPLKAFNLNVSEYDSFFVRAGNSDSGGVWVHNCNSAGRAKNKLKPDPDAVGDHTVVQRGADGKIYKYETYEKTSSGHWNPVKRYDGGKSDGSAGFPHSNKNTGESIPTPHVQGKNIPGGVRLPEPWEIPK